MESIAHEAPERAYRWADGEVIGERYFTSLAIDSHLPDSYYSLLFVLVYLSKGGRPTARGLTDLAERAGVARSTASLAVRGLGDEGFLHPVLRQVGGKPLRKVRCPRGGINIRLSSHQMTALAGALRHGRATGFHVRLLLWLVHNRAEDGRNSIVGYRRREIAAKLGVAARRVTEGVRTLERLDLLTVRRGRRGRWTLTPVAALASNHPKPVAVLRAARVARAQAEHDRPPADAIDAAAWAAAKRRQRGTQSNTQRGTQSNTPPAPDTPFPQVNAGVAARHDSVSSRGSDSVKALSFVGKRRTFDDRLLEINPDFGARWASRRKRE